MNRINLSALYFLLAFALFSCNKNDTPYTQDGNWIVRAQLNGSGRSEAAYFTIGDSAYIATGWDGLNVRYHDFWKYDVDLDGWTQMPSLPDSAARSSAVGFSIGNNAYVGTGYDGFNYLKDFYQFSYETMTWNRVADLPADAVPRYEAVAFSLGDYGYIGTGYDGSNAQKDFWKYDPSTNSWSNVPFSGNKRYGAIAFTYNNKAYLVTGVNSGTLVNDFWSFDPQASGNQWTKLSAIANVLSDSYDDGYTNIMRSNGVGFVMLQTSTDKKDKAYITTGENNGSLYTYTWEYDFATDRWKEKTPFERAARTGAVGFTLKNRGFVGLGRSSTGSTGALDDLMEWLPGDAQNSNDNQ